MRFDEFTAGRIIEAGPYSVNQKEIVDFAHAYDPQWFHTNPERAAKGRFDGLIASGWQTCGIAMRLIVDHALNGSESFASPGLEYVKWPAPVRAGDQLRLRAEVLEARRASKNPGLGILRWRWQLFNQQDNEVLDLVATSFFDLSDNPD